MLLFYSVIILETIFLMVILGLMVYYNDLLSREKRRLFFLLFSMIIAAAAAEWTGSLTYLGMGGSRTLHVWTKVAELSITPVIPFLCAQILRQDHERKGIITWYSYVLLFHMGLEVLSAFWGFIFYVDSDSRFCHGSFYWIYLAAYLGGALYVLWTGWQVSMHYQSRSRRMLVFMLAYLMFGITVNQINIAIKTAWLTVAIVVTLVYVFYNEMIQRVDEMTTLLNRTSYDNRVARLRRPVIIQFLDVDSFKNVNDKYGHPYGDHCLGVIGRNIRSIYGKSGLCYRVGGDEFCVILEQSQEQVEELNSRFFAAMQEQRSADPCIPYVSVGYASYDPAKDKVEEAVQTADIMMYRYKERNKVRYDQTYPVSMPEAEPAGAQRPREPRERKKEQKLDVSGLTDRTFAAFSDTSERSYLYLCNMSTNVSRWSRAAVDYFGLPGEYMLDAGKIWEEHIHPEDREAYQTNMEELFSGRSRICELEYRARNRYGEYVVCTCRGMVLKGNDTCPDLFAGTLVNHGIVDGVDPVTGLHNNNEFVKNIYRLIEEDDAACVIKIGIDNFRHINAMYGHRGGDRVLKLFAIEVQELVRGKGSLFRLEGAKFALYLNNMGREEAREIYGQIKEIAEEKIEIDNLRIPMRIYGGAVLLNHHFRSNYMVRSGLIYAMEQSQENHRGDLVFFEDTKKNGGIENIPLHLDIHRSAINGCANFFLCYQPIISFENKRVIGAEVLLRWKKEPYGVVPPDSFVPWLENDPVFIQVGNWILRQAIEETRPLRQADPDFMLNVNVAVTQLEHQNFRENVLDILEKTGCPPRNLCLELTERCRRLDPEFLAAELNFFRSHGITIAIDDFGTGFSSLTVLLQLPVDELKVDRLFMSGILENRSSLHMMEHILQGARQAGYRSCVEGIETQEEYDLIASMQGDCYQGYYSSRPVPIEGFLEFYNIQKEK